MTDPRTTGSFSDAMATVYGVATARYARNHAGARMLMEGHIADAVQRGESAVDAWSELFSAAIVALCDANTELARSRCSSPAAQMTTAALEHAAARVAP